MIWKLSPLGAASIVSHFIRRIKYETEYLKKIASPADQQFLFPDFFPSLAVKRKALTQRPRREHKVNSGDPLMFLLAAEIRFLGHRPRHPHGCRGAEQVDQIVIEQTATLKDRTQQTIDYGAEEAGKNDRRNRMDRHEPS